MKNFRLLRADEIDCRVAQIFERSSTCTLLLYKDARCDMNILDETVGAYSWKKEYKRDNANCIVSIYYPTMGEWIGKEDTGTESNTEAEKGLASDSFKRACVNWGIGRELYSAPRIVVPCTLVERNGKKVTYDRFTVKEISYDAKERIAHLVITKDGTKVFEWNSEEEEDALNSAPSEVHIKSLRKLMEKKGVTEEQVCERYKVPNLEDLTMEQYTYAVNALDKSKDKT